VSLRPAPMTLDRELLEIEILELNSHLEGTQNHVNGALRKMNFMVNQHKQLLEKVGKRRDH
jgi:hypothetical protein